MDLISAVLTTAAWATGIAVLLVMAALPWLEGMGDRR